MELPHSRAIAPDLHLLDEVGSTNAELVARASAGNATDFTVVVTTNQTAGRGRLDRVWVAPAGRTIAVSVLLSAPGLELEKIGWMPLLAGLAMTRAVASLVDSHAVTLKWPNDVQVDRLKVSGLLAELLARPRAVVVGAGLNLTMTPEELPTTTATSLTLMGVDEHDIVDRALAAYLGQLRALYDDYRASGFDPEVALREQVASDCSTIGQRVRVELPDGTTLRGTAEGIDSLGRLVVRDDSGLQAVAAGDVTHLRYE
ncbi:MAG: biotin--[acetyl-CoA-carboxylase] ligase [Rhodoglobus sp.]